MQTNEYIVINKNKQEEYDYPLTSTTNKTNSYTGNAGLKLNFIDRLILGIKEKNLKLAFSSNVTNESIIITTRNIRERAKAILPELMYDEEPYMVVTDNGDLVWILDVYTTSKNYPYSEPITIEYEGNKRKINYIRNSAKVIINAYTGETKFYITDRNDPIIMSYNKIYPSVFETESIPKSISNHIVYSKYLYNIQDKVLQRYHDVQAEVLYREDDVWGIAKENTSKATSNGNTTGTEIDPYYTLIKENNYSKTELGLIVPYTIYNKQNLVSYLVGTYDSDSNTQNLKMYRYKTGNAILGTIQLDTLVEQDEQIKEAVEAVNVSGTKITKNIIVVPINNTLLYVEPIYRTMLNEETQVPVLKKVIVASGDKVAIGDDLQETLKNLLSKDAISVDVNAENKEELIEQIISTNNNLLNSSQSTNWELMGKDMSKLQELIKELEAIIEVEKESKIEKITTNVQN